MTDNLGLFDAIKDELKSKVANRADKHIRFVGDCADLLFRNKHFDECIRLEEWGQQKPFEGSYLCPYPKQLIDKYPFSFHKFRVISNHDVVADENGNMVAAYIAHTSRRHD
jgi:hypothetical protein